MKRLKEIQIKYLIREIDSVKNKKKEKQEKIKTLASFFSRSQNSILSYYYRYKKNHTLSLEKIITMLNKDIQNTPFVYLVKAEKGKVFGLKARLNFPKFILSPKKRNAVVLQFPKDYAKRYQDDLDIGKVLNKLANMVKGDSLNLQVFENTKLKVVSKELDKYKLSSCKSSVEKEKLLKQNLLLKSEVERLKDKIKELRTFNIDKKE